MGLLHIFPGDDEYWQVPVEFSQRAKDLLAIGSRGPGFAAWHAVLLELQVRLEQARHERDTA